MNVLPRQVKGILRDLVSELCMDLSLGPNGMPLGPPVKMRIAVPADFGILLSKNKKWKGKLMPILAIFLFALVAAPFAGMVFGSVDRKPAVQQVQAEPYDIHLNTTLDVVPTAKDEIRE